MGGLGGFVSPGLGSGQLALGLLKYVRGHHRLEFFTLRPNLVGMGVSSAGLPLGGPDLPVAEFHESALALLVIGRPPDVDRIGQQVLDHVPVPEWAENRRDAQIVQSVCNLAGGDGLGRVPLEDQQDVLDPLGDNGRTVFQRLVKGLGRHVTPAVEPLFAPVRVDLAAAVVALVHHSPDLVALGVEGHHVTAVGAVAAKELALAGEHQLAG